MLTALPYIAVFVWLLNGAIIASRVNVVSPKPLSVLHWIAWIIAWPLMIWLGEFK